MKGAAGVAIVVCKVGFVTDPEDRFAILPRVTGGAFPRKVGGENRTARILTAVHTP